jgi:predicted lipoprotein with Yx(FWY)xxD motif
MKRGSWSRVLVGSSRGGALSRCLSVLAVAMIAAAALSAASASATVIYPPRLSAAVRTAEGFELKGVVYDYGGTTTYHFEYGTTTAYGTSVPMPDAEAGTGYSSSVAQPVAGLAADTVYHYRLVSNNTTEGMGVSEDGTFSTAVTPASPPPTGGGGQTPPAGSEGTATAGTGSKKVAKTLHLKGHTLLTTTSGHTLYSLSAERHGKFICTEASGCTGIWKPLTIPAGMTPQGPVKLGMIERPEGTVQVTYRGLPLYTFAADKKRGQVKGEGLKDVGTWHPATVSGSAGSGSNGSGSKPTPSPTPTPTPSPYPY